ncbi:MAG: alpha/beta hydrolase [Rickettsiales bacterium]|nr:alpha/beta hydrolase [Rickettsiales bacterium]
MRDGVIILHGIFRTHRSMRRLANFLEKEGFKVLNLDYPSTKYSIEALAGIIHPRITAFAESIPGKVHFVGYSMGGLVIRAYLHCYKPRNLGRVVMIGTPNQGSEVADFLQNRKLYHMLFGAAGQQLITNQSGFVHHFGETDYEVGVIAGNRPVDLISSRIIGKANDGKVSIESTKLIGMKDHVIVPSSHTFFPSNLQMWRQSLAFLKYGKFEQP